MLKRWAPLLVLSIGLCALSLATDGYRAFTTEGARRLQVLEKPWALPDVQMLDMAGESVRFEEFDGRLVLVDFIYTWCPTVCYAMGTTLEQVHSKLAEKGLQDEVAILSISFDPVRDDTEALRYYGDRHQATGYPWNVVTVQDRVQLQGLLDAFGVTVLPLADGEFEHNAAMHLVDRQGRLVEILGFNSAHAIVDAVEARL